MPRNRQPNGTPITRFRNRYQARLEDLCGEAMVLLKDKPIVSSTCQSLRQMRPTRQVEAAKLMISLGNYTSSFAQSLLVTSKPEDLLKLKYGRKMRSITAQQMGRMRREMAPLERDFKAIEDTYGRDILGLVFVSRYVVRLLRNDTIERYLREHHANVLGRLRAAVEGVGLAQHGSDKRYRKVDPPLCASIRSALRRENTGNGC